MSLPKIIGILNATPDSFYDGGKFRDLAAQLLQVERMLSEGADIIEVGGESTGPNSTDVSWEVEHARVIPLITQMHERWPHVVICIDTWKSAIANDAIAAGASMINDVTAGRADPNIFHVAAQSGADLVLMHSKDDSPRTTIRDVQYEDVIATIRFFLIKRIDQAKAAGVRAEQIIIDPGLGHFVSSDPQYSFEILRRLGELADLGRMLVSPSRKSFLAGPHNLPPAQRLPATLLACATAMKNGAAFIRTHDVQEVLGLIDRSV